MRVFKDPLGMEEPPRGAVLSIGNFDGVHLGHQAVLQHVVRRAEELGTSSAAMTFDPHPIKLLRPSEAPPLVTTLEQKIQLIEKSGIESVLILPFTHRVSRMTGLEFISTVLVDKLNIREVYIGANFRFGHDRGGDVKLLVERGAELGFAAAAAPIVELEGRAVSSTRVRSSIAEGRVQTAGELLGRPFFIDGTVLQGKRLGRKLGFPTINIEVANELIPALGVYITAVEIPSFSRTFTSVTNIGVRPTVYENSFTSVECHLLDFSADVYRESIRLHFLKRLRDEQTFPSPVQLMAQIRRDVEESRLWFLNNPLDGLGLVRS